MALRSAFDVQRRVTVRFETTADSGQFWSCARVLNMVLCEGVEGGAELSCLRVLEISLIMTRFRCVRVVCIFKRRMTVQQCRGRGAQVVAGAGRGGGGCWGRQRHLLQSSGKNHNGRQRPVEGGTHR